MVQGIPLTGVAAEGAPMLLRLPSGHSRPASFRVQGLGFRV